VAGDHPMVRFVDDFLSRHLSHQLAAHIDAKGSRGNSSERDEQNPHVFERRKVAAMESQSALETYCSRDSFGGTEATHSKMLRSSNPTAEGDVHFNYLCDFCECEPIRGKRFHCEECDNFDLWEVCHRKGPQLGGHSSSHRMTVVGSGKLRPELIEKVRKSKLSIRQKR
jgi:hypothetical protein